jgi:branched-chain amino acid transport system permease protein
MVQQLQRRLDGVSWVDLFLGALRIIIIVLIIWGAFNTLRSGKYTPSTWINLTISGLAQGSIYALIALGYTLVYGILLMINFAHGEVFMSGAFTAVFFAQYFNRIGLLNRHPFLVILILILIAAAVSTTIAIVLERVA